MLLSLYFYWMTLVQKLHLCCNVSCPSSPPSNHVPLYCHDNTFKRQAWKYYLHVNILQRFQTITGIRINQKSLTWPRRLFQDLFTTCLSNLSLHLLFFPTLYHLNLVLCSELFLICQIQLAIVRLYDFVLLSGAFSWLLVLFFKTQNRRYFLSIVTELELILLILD